MGKIVWWELGFTLDLCSSLTVFLPIPQGRSNSGGGGGGGRSWGPPDFIKRVHKYAAF